jgi:hypothetical protein
LQVAKEGVFCTTLAVASRIMRVATVQFAPMEYWCDVAKEQSKHYPLERLVGAPVEIITDSMSTAKHSLDGEQMKVWRVTERSVREINKILGVSWPENSSFVCEHILAMD